VRDSRRKKRPYGEGAVAGFEAVATVACDLTSAGPFRTIAMPATAGEVENRWVLHLDVFFNARAAFLAGYDRSILKGGVEEWRER
jgi:hypothetical protein